MGFDTGPSNNWRVDDLRRRRGAAPAPARAHLSSISITLRQFQSPLDFSWWVIIIESSHIIPLYAQQPRSTPVVFRFERQDLIFFISEWFWDENYFVRVGKLRSRSVFVGRDRDGSWPIGTGKQELIIIWLKLEVLIGTPQMNPFATSKCQHWASSCRL